MATPRSPRKQQPGGPPARKATTRQPFSVMKAWPPYYNASSDKEDGDEDSDDEGEYAQNTPDKANDKE